MKQLHTEESIAKSRETKANNLPQISDAEERESHINIDHFEQKAYVYTNNATVMNRLDRLGLPFVSEDYLDGQVYGRNYEVELDKLGDVMRVPVYKCN